MECLDERKEREKIIQWFFAGYGMERQDMRISLYSEVLSDIPLPVLQKVCRKMLIEQRNIPAVADIIAAGRSLVGEVTGERVKSFAEAWEEVQAKVHDCFVYAKPEWSTIEIALAVQSFGYKELCELQTDQLRTAHAQFRRIYEDVCARTLEKRTNDYVLNNTGKPLAIGQLDKIKRIAEKGRSNDTERVYRKSLAGAGEDMVRPD
nr:MAG TPA: Loader and inhibitor of phage G40P [Caudoviricetes sp.]